MVSIISALYKSERYLPGFIKHAKNFAGFLLEKKIPFEICIISTFPSEKEKKILGEIIKEPWCSFHEFNERGLYKAWNYGVKVSKGTILGPWNADDVRFPEAVMEAEGLVKNGAEICYFPFFLKRYISFGPISIPVVTKKVEGQVLEFEKRKFETTMTAGPHFMFTREAYKKTGPFDEQFKIAGDFDWCARAAAMGLKFSLGQKFSGVFRVDGRGLSAGANRLLVAENNIIYRRQGAFEKVISGVEDLEKNYRI